MDTVQKKASGDIPSIQSKDKLNLLSKTFKPDDVKFLLSLKSKSSLQECIDNAEVMVKRLQKFVDNNHSCEGLDFKYSNVQVF